MAITTVCAKCSNNDLEIRMDMSGIIIICHNCEKATKIGRADDYPDYKEK